MKPTRECPGCAGGRRDLLFEQRFAMIDGVSVLDGYDVVVCRDCGLTFADRTPSQAALDGYYRNASKYAYTQRNGAESQADAARLAITADTVARLAPARDVRVLDVGCATGRLLAELRQRGYMQLSGIDPSLAATEAAHRIHQVDARAMTVTDVATQGQTFDLVLLVGVLEHLRDLDATAASLHALLAPGGAVYVEVPDVMGFADWLNAPYQELSVEHINYFSASSLTLTMARRGFRAVAVERNTRWQTARTEVANLSALFVRDDSTRTTARDGASGPAMQRYLDQSARRDALVRRRAAQLIQTHGTVTVWGTGTLTLRLIASGAIDVTHVTAFADSNSYYQGATICTRPVVAPSDLFRLKLPVVVSSWAFGDDMIEQFSDTLRANCFIVTMIDNNLYRTLSTI